ncbi:hypothetical protein ACIPYV_13035 [Paenarthrobacter nicotinovorans]|uniref:hypothetical protein n=1 Tax=Paenarthrobacter nicotinovorans TaxID=29320 RepID=UPI003823B96C
MSVSERLQQAADRFLGGDESVCAAQALEEVLVEEYLGDDRTEELLYVFRCIPLEAVRRTPRHQT